MSATALRRVFILGVPVDDVTEEEACTFAERCLANGGVHQFATVNPEFIMAAQHNAAFMHVLQHTALNVPDGIGVLWAARRKGAPLRARVAGVDLMVRLCALAAQRGWRVFLLGAQPGVAARAAALLRERYPSLRVCGTFAGSPRPEEATEIVQYIRAAAPHLLFVAYGAPAQDLWLATYLPLLQTPEQGLIGMGVGGAFDFIAGVQRRAPKWVQRIGLEWFYRLVRQPWRWRRQRALVHFVWRVLREEVKL